MATNENTATVELVSDEGYDNLIFALESAHNVVKSYTGETLPPFDSCTEKDYEEIIRRTFRAVVRTRKTRRDLAFKGAKVAVDALIHETRIEGRKALAAFKAVISDNPSLAKLLPAPKSTVEVAVSDFSDCFAEGTSETDMVKWMKDNDIEVCKGADKKGPLYVKVNLNA